MFAQDNLINISGSIHSGYNFYDNYSFAPYFDKDTNNEMDKSNDALAIMAVDNLPSELPRDSSTEFGDGIVKEVLPYIINDDDQRIHNATITKNGNFLSKSLMLV